LVVNGVTRTNNYTGYQNSFKFVGDFDQDNRPMAIIFIDALPGGEQDDKTFLRELNKAYIGFSCDTKGLPIATGHWGCGAFGGNHKFKTILQLLAASEAERNLHYATFGNNQYTDEFPPFLEQLQSIGVTVGELFKALRGKYVNRQFPLYKQVIQDIFQARNINPSKEKISDNSH